MKCPICGKYKEHKQEMIDHIDNTHSNDIQDNMSTAKFLYTQTHGRDYGLCRVCGKPTPWNEKSGKPSQLCGREQCKKTQRKKAYDNMMRIYGKSTLLTDPNHQQKMLANRKISGTYRWSDGKHKFTYTGSYEKYVIEWLDKVMMLNPDKIQMPGPVIPYEFDGEIKNWITDLYLEDFNLIVEVKDGGDMKNMHPGFAHNRELESAKDLCMKNQNEYNYIKLTNRNMLSLINTMTDIKLNNIFDNNKNKDKIISINESIDTNIISKLTGDDVLYIVLCKFDDEYTGIGIINKDFNNLFTFKNNIKVNKVMLYKIQLNDKLFTFNKLNKLKDYYYDTKCIFEKLHESNDNLKLVLTKIINDIMYYPENNNDDNINTIELLYDGDNCNIRELPKLIPELITNGYMYKSNSDLDKLYESFINENSNNNIFKYGNGSYTTIPTNHDYNIIQNPVIDENDDLQKWTNNITNVTPDPFVWSNNFIMKEIGELRTDIETDPCATSGSIIDVTKDIYSSNFTI